MQGKFDKKQKIGYDEIPAKNLSDNEDEIGTTALDADDRIEVFEMQRDPFTNIEEDPE